MLSGFADEHVKAAIIEGSRLRDMDVVTAHERGQRQVDDETLPEVATGTTIERLGECFDPTSSCASHSIGT